CPTSEFQLLPVVLFSDPATTELYTLSLHDALPISGPTRAGTASEELDALPFHARREPAVSVLVGPGVVHEAADDEHGVAPLQLRSEEHTSELQSRENLVCRLLLEKKKKHED